MEICKQNEFCGGCIHQGVPYEQQLKAKESEVKALLREKEVDASGIKFDAIEGCPSMYNYRNKMEYTFGDLVKDGEMTLGMHKKGHFMSIVTVDECQLVDPDFNKVLRYTLDFAIDRGYKQYHKRSHLGLMRNLIIRKGVRYGELLVNIVTSSDGLGEGAEFNFDEEAYVKGLLELDLNNTIVGILRTINDDLADAVKCDELKTLYGRDYYMEEILGLKFKVSAFSFFQTNVEAVERLYKEALDLIDDFEGKTVFDLYCGTGTISQILALKAKEVVGVEIVEEAVDSARKNADLNGLDNCKFIAGDCFKVLDGQIGAHIWDFSKKPDVIVVDPPRVGIQTKALDKIARYGVEQILYISCNPKTLAINLKEFEAYGYKAEYIKPFDNFPMTKHTECICLLSKVKESVK
ncbi:MAG: 23S rRNA (uracil(1939)-C(5))-methyltransferase RlmD [Clostridia bacterium]|nr:23S rRNA (uracil(1939)-C(5))-methyltransferase RlmD [Clostridia bacterium]